MIHLEIEKAFFNTEITVAWGEMDAAQHVNNTVYLRWAEAARIGFYEKLKCINFDFRHLGIILAWQDCKYIFPITYPDRAILTYDIIEVKHDRLIGECCIYSEKHQRISAISKSTVMAYDYSVLAKANIPEQWLSEIFKIYPDLKIS